MDTVNGVNNHINGGAPSEPVVKAFDKKSVSGGFDFDNAGLKKVKAEVRQKAGGNAIDPGTISESVDKANKLVLIFDKSIKFVYNAETGKNYIDIVDNNTNEVIKQIPSEAIRRFLEAVEGAVGMIVDEKA